MFLRMTNTVILAKNSLHIKKDFKIDDGRQFGQKIRYRYVINLYASLDIALIVPK